MTTLDMSPAWAAATQAAEMEAINAASTFATALRGTPEYHQLLATNDAMGADTAARRAIDAYSEKQDEYRVEATMGLLSEEQADELGQLLRAMHAVPSVAAYVEASGVFAEMCRETAAVVSGLIGIDFAANSRSGGCCG